MHQAAWSARSACRLASLDGERDGRWRRGDVGRRAALGGRGGAAGESWHVGLVPRVVESEPEPSSPVRGRASPGRGTFAGGTQTFGGATLDRKWALGGTD